MKQSLEQKFQDRWPDWFKGMNESAMRSCMAFGITTDDGWFDLLWDLCLDIERCGVDDDFIIFQVKEKFGGLRFYTSGASSEVYDLIYKAENKSYHICETCGSTTDVETQGNNWLKTLCRICRTR